MSFVGCYSDENRYDETVHLQTIAQCRDQSYGGFFGMTRPSDVSGVLLADCLLLTSVQSNNEDRPWAGPYPNQGRDIPTKVPDYECEAGMDSFGNRLGDSDRLAVYRRSFSRVGITFFLSNNKISLICGYSFL